MLLAFGGHETTMNLIANEILALIGHPTEWDRLGRTPGLVIAADEGGQSVVTDACGDSEDVILDAAEQCPMEAITVEDARRHETVPPSDKD